LDSLSSSSVGVKSNFRRCAAQEMTMMMIQRWKKRRKLRSNLKEKKSL